jgi:hypothetical protein
VRGLGQGRRLVLSLNGIRIHRAVCQWARPNHVRRWLWADQVSPQEIRDEVASLGLRPCTECDPLADL